MSKRRIYPVPEFIADTAVEVVSGTGSMDNTGKVMRVPLGDSPADRHVRAHEMAHAKYSPAAPTGPKSTNPMAIQRAEDMRMNLYCRRQGLIDAMDAPIIETDEMMTQLVRQPLASGEVLPAVTAAASCYRTGDWQPCMDAIAEVDSAMAEKIARFIPTLWNNLEKAGEPQWGDALANAAALTRFAEDPEAEDSEDSDGEAPPEESEDSDGEAPPEESEAGPEESAGSGEGDSEDSEDSEASDGTPRDSEAGGEEMIPVDLSGDPLDELVDARLVETLPEATDTDPIETAVLDMEKRMKRYSRRTADLAEMRIVHLPLRQRLTVRKMKGRGRVAAAEGRVPGYMGRYCSDKSVFVGQGKRRGGGAILIDTSGSMELASEDVDRILTEAPAAVVATYGGFYQEGRGELKIIAAKGKRALPSENLRAGDMTNEVDVTALEWLAKQEGDKYWLCDGIVTGQYDHPGDNITSACAEICRKSRILRVPDLGELIEALK